jgi:16S rRNA (guanine966-N2)-methyltransferase
MKNEIRIIGGTWRSRKIRFPAAPGLRPSPDRVRETLFNWLGQDLEGLVCLNLYAGSGVLGFEAASRGAKRVVQVERSPEACIALKQNREQLAARAVQIVSMDVSRFLAGSTEAFDLVFLDPPFHQGLVEPCCHELEGKGWLAAHGRVYIEAEKEKVWGQMPETWQIYRHKQAGGVDYRLCQRRPAQPISDLGLAASTDDHPDLLSCAEKFIP